MGQKPLVSVLRAVRGVGEGGAAIHVAYFLVVGGQGVKMSKNMFLSILFCFDVPWEGVGGKALFVFVRGFSRCVSISRPQGGQGKW